MESNSLKISVTSAKWLKKVKDVFVAVKLSGDPKSSNHHEQRTQVARDCGTNPKWNQDDVLNFSIDQTLAQANRLILTFKIKCEQQQQREGDKDIGEVHVPVKELIDHLGNDKIGQRYVTYKIKKSNGKPRGDISCTYSLGGPTVFTSGAGCVVPRYIAHEPVRPAAADTHHPVTNGPVLSQLLPSVGSFSYGHVPSQPQPVYPPPVAQSEILQPSIFPGLYQPMHGYAPERPATNMHSTPIFPGLSCPPDGYPTVAPPQHTPPGLYPPASFYRF